MPDVSLPSWWRSAIAKRARREWAAGERGDCIMCLMNDWQALFGRPLTDDEEKAVEDFAMFVERVLGVCDGKRYGSKKRAKAGGR